MRAAVAKPHHERIGLSARPIRRAVVYVLQLITVSCLVPNAIERLRHLKQNQVAYSPACLSCGVREETLSFSGIHAWAATCTGSHGLLSGGV
jgi:hypothetical protein